MALTLKAISETKPYWVFDAEHGACPQCSPADAIDGGFWTCSHIQRLVVDEVPAVGHKHDSRVCPGNCPQHPLVPASGLLRLYFDAAVTGLLWGDILSLQEEAERNAETPSQRAAREAREAAAAAVAQAKIVSYHVEKCASVYCDKEGNLKKTIMKKCKWDDHPAENGFHPGCGAHLGKACKKCQAAGEHLACCKGKVGACPWVHKDQPDLMAELLSGTGGRDFSALRGGRGPSSSSSSSSARPPLHPHPRPSSGGGGHRAAGGGSYRGAGSGGDGSAW
jgi:hypothetical protein